MRRIINRKHLLTSYDLWIKFHPVIILVNPGDAYRLRNLSHWVATVVPDPPQPHWLPGEALVNGWLPDVMTEIPASCFLMAHEDWGGGLPTEKRSGRGLHSFLAHLASGVDPVPGLERICLLGVDQD